MRELKIALGQMAAVQGDTEANLKKMEAMICEASGNGADLICFPELSYTGYFVRKERLELIAEKGDGLFVTRLCELAVRYGIGIAGGFAERDGENIYNSCVLVDRRGAVAGKARKVHLWKSEKKRFAAGEEYPVFDTEFGRIAFIICYDLEFPEPARIAALKGAELLLCPAAWSVPAARRWELDIAGNSLFNLLYIAGANFSDELCCGRSGVAGPDGIWTACAEGQEETIVYAQIDFDYIKEMRERLPYYEDLQLKTAKELVTQLEHSSNRGIAVEKEQQR